MPPKGSKLQSGSKQKTAIQSETHTRKRQVKLAEMPPKGSKLQSGSKQKTTTKQRVKGKKLPVKAGPAKEMTGTLQEARPSQTKRMADTRQDATRKRQRLAKGASRQSGASVKRERKGKAIQVSAKATEVKDEPNPEAFIRKQEIKDQVSVETVHKRGNNKQCAAAAAAQPERLIGQCEKTVPPRGGLGDKSSVVPAFLKPKTSFLVDQVKTILLSATSRATFETKYEKFAKIGEGGFGSVYAGHRKTDSNPVAIKYIPKTKVKNVPLSINGKVQKVPLEAVFMLQASSIKNSDGKSAVIALLEICDLEKDLVLIMERPVRSVALSTYLMWRTLLEEDEAKYIMKQLVDAAIKMHAANIFHRDLKQENILLEASPGVTRVRVIDFGCSCLVSMEPYHDYFGTLKYAPPEYTHKRPYCAGPTTVWHLGALLFELLDGKQRFDTCMFLSEGLKLNRDLSEDCEDFLWLCLSLDPTQRCTLEQMLWHPWLL
ncbi:serine/threonine-protein kinase pim-2-like [Syngnathus acus]|uniref:serine/threonine-protein kinase pim-2-like n=1 Tax=Syngnathus acus TaxID=161584 RepID=UPI001885CE78|nr:serine/threonine-protein kinase pim-2-like [Syngnathus acus]